MFKSHTLLRLSAPILLFFCSSTFTVSFAKQGGDAIESDRASQRMAAYFRSISHCSFKVSCDSRMKADGDVNSNQLVIRLELDRTPLSFRRQAMTPNGNAVASEALLTDEGFLDLMIDVKSKKASRVMAYQNIEARRDSMLGIPHCSLSVGLLPLKEVDVRVEDLVDSGSIISESDVEFVLEDTYGAQLTVQVDPLRQGMPIRIVWNAPIDHPTSKYSKIEYAVVDSARVNGVEFPQRTMTTFVKPERVRALPPGVKRIDGMLVLIPPDNNEGPQTEVSKGSELVSQCTFSEISVYPESIVEYVPRTSIDDGTRVTMMDAQQLQFVWLDGQIQALTNDGVLSMSEYRFQAERTNSTTWMVIGIFVFVCIASVWFFNRRRASPS